MLIPKNGLENTEKIGKLTNDNAETGSNIPNKNTSERN